MYQRRLIGSTQPLERSSGSFFLGLIHYSGSDEPGVGSAANKKSAGN
jgi:hypothetical protein